jgi:hypothetical protein
MVRWSEAIECNKAGEPFSTACKTLTPFAQAQPSETKNYKPAVNHDVSARSLVIGYEYY